MDFANPFSSSLLRSASLKRTRPRPHPAGHLASMLLLFTKNERHIVFCIPKTRGLPFFHKASFVFQNATAFCEISSETPLPTPLRGAGRRDDNLKFLRQSHVFFWKFTNMWTTQIDTSLYELLQNNLVYPLDDSTVFENCGRKPKKKIVFYFVCSSNAVFFASNHKKDDQKAQNGNLDSHRELRVLLKLSTRLSYISWILQNHFENGWKSNRMRIKRWFKLFSKKPHVLTN